MSTLETALLVGAVSLLVGGFFGWLFRWIFARFQLTSSEQKAERIKSEAVKEADAAKKEYLLEARDKALQERNQQEKEFRERRFELQKFEKRLLQKEENLDAKTVAVDKKTQQNLDKENSLKAKEADLKDQEAKWRTELEKIAHLSQKEAKALMMQSLEDEARHDAQALLNKVEQEAKISAEKKAREILVSVIQRIDSEAIGDVSIASVDLPGDEMKGRIIGREGRNIRTLETLTGADIIIDDTPEAVVISCFNPVRKEVAKIALQRLIQDGRIHPTRIEEIVYKVKKEINQKILEEGEGVAFRLGIHNFSQEAIRAIGTLYFRTSYGQNVLEHSKEVALLSAMIAGEVGADRELAKRAGLLHDVGKGMESDGDSNHAELGGELARKIGEHPVVVNAVLAHHNDVEPTSVEAIIVQIADAISAARPGARKETLESYIKRLENLEVISTGFEGVEKAFAIQAGRELRVLVDHTKVDDVQVAQLAKDIAKRIETELKYPGRIKVTMIRETRVVEYAR